MDIAQSYLDFIGSLNGGPLAFLVENKIIYSIIILLVFMGLSKLVRYSMRNIVPKFTQKTKTILDDIIVDRTQKPIAWIVFFLGLPPGLHTVVDAVIFFSASFFLETTLITLAIWSNSSEKEDTGTLTEVMRDMVNLSTNVFRPGKWRVEKSHIVPYSPKGMGFVFLSVSICGSILPIIITMIS